MLGEVGGHLFGLADEVDVAEQGRRDLAQLRDLPIGTDAAAVALERPLTLRQDRVELRGRLVLVLAVGEQDGVVDRAGVRVEERCGRRSATARSRCRPRRSGW